MKSAGKIVFFSPFSHFIKLCVFGEIRVENFPSDLWRENPLLLLQRSRFFVENFRKMIELITIVRNKKLINIKFEIPGKCLCCVLEHMFAIKNTHTSVINEALLVTRKKFKNEEGEIIKCFR